MGVEKIEGTIAAESLFTVDEIQRETKRPFQTGGDGGEGRVAAEVDADAL